MSTDGWHIPRDLWGAYARGALSPAAEASLEAHLVGCGRCRVAARRQVSAESAWPGVQAAIAAPRVPWPLRAARALGVAGEDVALLAASRSLWIPWIVALGGALVSVLVSANLADYYDTAYLVLSPLVPVAAVAVSYDAVDPLREVAAATPYSKLRLALLRTIAVLVVSVPVMLLLSGAVPALRPMAWVWLLPALGLTTGTLLLLRRLSARVSATITGGGWLIAVLVAHDVGHVQALARPAGQAVFALISAILIAALVGSMKGAHR